MCKNKYINSNLLTINPYQQKHSENLLFHKIHQIRILFSIIYKNVEGVIEYI